MSAFVHGCVQPSFAHRVRTLVCRVFCSVLVLPTLPCVCPIENARWGLDRSRCASGRRFLLIHLAASVLTTDTSRMAQRVLCACVGLRQQMYLWTAGNRSQARMFLVPLLHRPHRSRAPVVTVGLCLPVVHRRLGEKTRLQIVGKDIYSSNKCRCAAC